MSIAIKAENLSKAYQIGEIGTGTISRDLEMIGKSKIAYNVHRIYSYQQIMSYFEDLELQEFSLIPDNFSRKRYYC